VPAITIASLVILALGAVGWFALHHRRLTEAAAQWSRRRGLSDDEFLRQCHVPGEPFAILAALSARRAVASLATVPAETIRPDDSFARDLSQLPFWDSLDWLGFVLEVEKQSGFTLRVTGAAAHGAVKAAGGYQSLRVRDVVRSAIALTTAPL
jgi:hypothetical protein